MKGQGDNGLIVWEQGLLGLGDPGRDVGIETVGGWGGILGSMDANASIGRTRGSARGRGSERVFVAIPLRVLCVMVLVLRRGFFVHIGLLICRRCFRHPLQNWSWRSVMTFSGRG